MVKRKTTKKKSTSKKKTAKSTVKRASHEAALERVLIENFVSLQKVMTNLSVRLDDLTDKMGKLLDVFEISAKALAKKDFQFGKDDLKILNKLDKLAEDNKVIARGLTLIHEGSQSDYYEPGSESLDAMPQPMQKPSLLPLPKKPRMPMRKPSNAQTQEETPGFEGYQKSISSQPREFSGEV
ncbi:MAG: hypothetical protein ABIB79_04800 [archaeon]